MTPTGVDFAFLKCAGVCVQSQHYKMNGVAPNSRLVRHGSCTAVHTCLAPVLVLVGLRTLMGHDGCGHLNHISSAVSMSLHAMFCNLTSRNCHWFTG